MTPNELTKAICDYGLKPYITFEIVRNHYECSLKPEYQNRIEWKYNSNVDHILTIAFTCKHQTVKRRLLHLKRMIDQELLKRYRILDRNANWALTQSESQENTIHKTHVYDLDNKKENPMELTQIINYLKRDHHNIVDLFFEKIQTYKDEDHTFNLLVDLSNPADISARVETDINTGHVQGPFLKIFTVNTGGLFENYTKSKLYPLIEKELEAFEHNVISLGIKKQTTVTTNDKRRLVDLLDREEAKYFLKDFADCETECTLDEGWLIDADKSSKALQSAYYQSLKTDQERQIYATAIGQQYALDLLCSTISEVLRMYDLEHLNTFFKTVELVIT